MEQQETTVLIERKIDSSRAGMRHTGESERVKVREGGSVRACGSV